MNQHLLFVIVGLGAGAAYAAVAMALVTTYRGTGVINIAQGAMAVWGAYVFQDARVVHELPTPVAMALGFVAVAVLALVLHVLVFRPLRTAPALSRVVASVGVTITIQAAVILQFGTARRAVPATLPNEPVRLWGISFSQDRLWLAGVAIVLAVALWAYGRFTRIGLATRAASQSERGAVLMGFSPDRLGAVTWVLASVVPTFVAMLVAPTVGLDAIAWTFFVVPALACALAGRLESVGIACAAGLALGSVQAEITFLSSKTWWPDWATVGVAQSVPLVVIAVVLFALGHRLPTRGSLRIDRLPPVRVPELRAGTIAALTTVGVLAVVLTDGTYRFGVITSMIAAIIALSLVVLVGLVGQISLAQAAFAGSAGFALSKIGTGLPFPISLLVAAGVATVLGLLVSIPALRIRGVQLAVVTLAAGVAIEELVFHNPKLSPSTGNLIPDPRLFGIDLGVREGTTTARWQFGLLVLTVLVLACIGVGVLARSSFGRALLAVRSNERAAASVGVDVAGAKLLAFAASSFLAGVGGALIGYSRGQLSPESFGVPVSLSLLAFAYLGGITSIGGALLAGTFAPLGIGYVVLDRTFHLGRHYLLASGVLLVATAVFNPSGMITTFSAALRRGRRHELPVLEVERPALAAVLDGAL
ncbi:MAG TPA: ABC transporter permease [Acidimicrobiales bacterium]|nr:ABC transporter permease [Acidimicrobiales bacterium]